MTLIKILLILAAVYLILVAIKNNSSKSNKAFKKIGLIGLGALMIIVVIFPELANQAAKLVGVGRGADLLLYITVVAFIMYILNDYLYKQKQRDLLIRLARTQALDKATKTYANNLRKS